MNAIKRRYGTVLRCYDNGGKTCDRYTILPPRWAKECRERGTGLFEALAASEYPFHPQGVGMSTLAAPGPHLGRRVTWEALPLDVRRFAQARFPEYAPLG